MVLHLVLKIATDFKNRHTRLVGRAWGFCIVADSRNTMESGSPNLSDHKKGCKRVSGSLLFTYKYFSPRLKY
jgi:hypothetical protein